MNRDKFLKVEFSPQIEPFFCETFPKGVEFPEWRVQTDPSLSLFICHSTENKKSFLNKYYLNVSIGYQMICFYMDALETLIYFPLALK